MKKTLWLILTLILSTTIAYATLTNGNLPSTKNGASNPPTIQNSPVSTDGTNTNIYTLQGNVGINGTTGALSVPGSLSSTGTLGAVQFPQVPTPGSNPGAATDYLYVKSDDKLYTLNSSGSETAVQASQWTGTNPIYYSNNVGIGSAYPGQILDVQGTVRATNFVGSGVGLTGIVSYSQITQLGNNIGIGSTIPGQMLDVQGTVRATGFVGNGSLLTSLPPSFFVTGNVGINTTSNVGIGSVNPGQLLDIQGTVRGIQGIFTGTGISNFSGGNVGIGSAAPGTALDVQGSVRISNIGSTTGYRYVCVGTTGVLESQAGVCAGT